MSDKYLGHLNDHVPVGSFITLPPRYTIQHGAVLRVIKPFWTEEHKNSFINLRTGKTISHMFTYGGFDCYWPDGGYKRYEAFLIHTPTDLHQVIDVEDEQTWAMRALAGYQNEARCPYCHKKLRDKEDELWG